LGKLGDHPLLQVHKLIMTEEEVGALELQVSIEVEQVLAKVVMEYIR
jgi:hypothetical protein